MQKSIATFWPPFPPQRLRRPVIFWNHPIPCKTNLTAFQSGKAIALKERLPCPWPVSKLPGASVSSPLLFSENSLSNVLQTDVKCRSDVTKWLSLGYSWPSVSTCGYRIVAFKLQKNILTRIDLGMVVIDPRPSFQTVWLNQKCWYLKNVQKDVECRRDAKGCYKRLSCLIAGHQSAPGVREWLPSSSKSILTRIGLGKMIIDPRPSFQAVWLNQKCWYLKNVQKDVECRRDAKGWLSGYKLSYSWPSVSSLGSRMAAFKLQKHFDTHWPGEDDYRPASFFPSGLVEPKVLVSKECAEGCRM